MPCRLSAWDWFKKTGQGSITLPTGLIAPQLPDISIGFEASNFKSGCKWDLKIEVSASWALPFNKWASFIRIPVTTEVVLSADKTLTLQGFPDAHVISSDPQVPVSLVFKASIGPGGSDAHKRKTVWDQTRDPRYNSKSAGGAIETFSPVPQPGNGLFGSISGGGELKLDMDRKRIVPGSVKAILTFAAGARYSIFSYEISKTFRWP